ncbi:MAG TPA: hypothetical protein VJ692_12950 [Nitrospiraceae bacterium]|nr:hypothetical protein [Nitrospiraceae bacterium]
MGALPARHDDSPEDPVLAPVGELPQPDRQDARLRRYSLIVTAAMIVLCNAIFLLGIWGSGVNLDELIRTPDLFNPLKDICLRLMWRKVEGEAQPIQLCSEWINLSDPSGNTHSFQKQTEVVKGGDGKLYFDHGVRVDYRLFLFAGFIIAIIIFGFALRRFLIRRYRRRLEAASGSTSSLAL